MELPNRPYIPKARFIQEPGYGYSRDNLYPYKPTANEIFRELKDTVNFLEDSRKIIPAAASFFHLFTFSAFLVFLAQGLSIGTVLFLIVTTIAIGTIFHTIWLHNYCSHKAFKWSHPIYSQFFLWLNPLFLPEQGYAITHLYHHQCADKVGDPHGPHLGWLGSYFAVDSFSNLNMNIDSDSYETLERRVRHMGYPINDYATFQKTGSTEKVWFFWTRTIFAQTFWGSLVYGMGGTPYLMAWLSSIFVFVFLFRDFGWRAHGGARAKKIPGWEFDTKSKALNQHFYGYIASEWHDNHHVFPSSANYGFLPGQPQLSFMILKALKQIGIVASYTDSAREFRRMIEATGDAKILAKIDRKNKIKIPS